MEGLIILLVLVLVVAPIATAIWAIVQVNAARRRLEELARRLGSVELELHHLKSKPAPAIPISTPTPTVATLTAEAPPPIASTLLEQLKAHRTTAAESITPPPVAPLATLPVTLVAPPPLSPAPAAISQPASPPLLAPAPARPALPAINWENFLGVKLFAWVGGLLLFLGVAFFIKYSFENNLIKPPMRIALGYLTGLGLLIGGLRMPRERYSVLVQTLCAAAILIFYGTTFAAHGMYDLLPQMAAFGLMALVTAVAFVLAARLDAQVVAVLGMLGGFLTPVLLATGKDQSLGLFTYIALLDIGLVTIALRQRWNYLVLLGWIGTALMQIGWTAKFYQPEKILTAMAIYLGFSALFVGGFIAACRVRGEEKFTTAAALLAPGAALLFAFLLVVWPHAAVTGQPALLFSFALLAAGGWLVLAHLREALRPAHLAGAAGVVLLLGIWSIRAPAVGMLHAALGLYLLFAALFIGMFALERRRGGDDQWSAIAGAGAAGAALVYALYVLGRVEVGAFPKPWLFFGFVFLADAGLLAMAAMRERLRPIHLGAGGAVFLLLALWTGKVVTPDLLNWALGIYLLFAILHSVYPVVLQRLRPAPHPLWWAHLFPVAALLLLLMPLMKFESSPIIIWPVILIVDLLAIALAAVTASLLAVAAVLVITLGITACWIFRIPAELTGLPMPLLVIGGFAIVFFVAGLWVTRKVLARIAANPADAARSSPATAAMGQWLGADPMAHLPAASALLPFLLLIMLTTRLALPNPSPVFGLAALLIVLLLGVVRLYGFDALCGVGLVATLLLEHVWHAKHYAVESAALALGWHLGFAVVFLVLPFLFRERFRDRVIPWAVSALALPLHFKLIYGTVKSAWLAGMLGIVPATLSVPLFIGLVVLLRWLPADAPKRNTLLALFGGAALFFVTLIFPIQFSNQWLTVAWALEGAALLWLFHRVPHPGLRIVGGALLVVAFVRLGLNPAVFDYASRSTTPILNWYLYSYGLVTLALFAGVRLLAPPRERVGKLNLRALLAVLGTVLAFILVNIEIADYFSTGTRIEFRFSGSFARDMTYSLAWAVFAGIVLGVGVRQRLAAARYAGLGLLVVTLLKLFLHDLWQLRGLYRIGSLIGLAVALMLVSFVYQKFLATGGKKDEPPPEPPLK